MEAPRPRAWRATGFERMPKIARLPPALANQIAAGEVVERPASVVKELIENAIDAGATRIAITAELGGKRLIRVEDDGEGMDPDDARACLDRHATSKLTRAEDLERVLTLGFRGEALPSIASVSRCRIRTRHRDHPGGTEVRVEGGGAMDVRDAGAAPGTLVEVADLFYNVPARRKFLKSDAAESAQISRIVTQMALGYPEIGFTLTSGARTVVSCPPAGRLEARLFQLYGERPDLVRVSKRAAGVGIEGFVAALADQGPVRGPQHVFVNRRIVRDRTLAHAIAQAYSSATLRERSPEVHLFLDIAPDRVDVNVHPTKAEVRFLDQSLVHEVLRRALMDALGQPGAAELTLQPAAPGGPEPRSVAIPGVLAGGAFPSRWTEAASAGGAARGAPSPGAAVEPAAGERDARREVDPIRPMIPLGQFRDTFIIAVDDEGIAIVDQHVAHERVLFERVMERLMSGPLESQRLLQPVLLELPAGQREALLAHRDDLGRLGFEVETFGGTSVRVSAVPALLRLEEAEAAIRALALDLEGLDRGSSVQDVLRRVAATTACHAAVRANDPLTRDKMQHILEELRRTAFSSVCPHGRPVVLRLTRREIEKNFQRI